MKKILGGLSSAALTCALILGCGGSGENETKEFKATDTSQFDEMKNQMIEQFKTKSFQKQGYVPPEKKAAPK